MQSSGGSNNKGKVIQHFSASGEDQFLPIILFSTAKIGQPH